MPADAPATLADLRGAFSGQPCSIVGKGPSLALLRREHLVPGPVITLNQAVLRVERLQPPGPVFSMQKDGCGSMVPGHVCAKEVVRPAAATLLVHLHESPHCLEDYRPRITFDATAELGLPWREFSANCAIALARLLGCPAVRLIAFDACTCGDLRSIDSTHPEPLPAYVDQCARMAPLLVEADEWLQPDWDGSVRRYNNLLEPL